MPCSVRGGSGNSTWQETPSAPNDRSVFAFSVNASARSISSRPKPLRDGLIKPATPLSRQSSTKVPAFCPPGRTIQDTVSCPGSSLSAPCLTALVASSCRASPKVWTSSKPRATRGPETETFSSRADRRQLQANDVAQIDMIVHRAADQALHPTKGAQPSGKRFQRAALGFARRRQIDQQIAAGDQIDARERRVPNDTVRREDTQRANVLGDHEAGAARHEEPLAALRRHGVEQRLRIARRACDREHALIDVGCEYLHARNRGQPFHMFASQHGDRKHLLARGAAWNPYAHGVVGAAALEQLRNDRRGQRLERIFVPEEVRDVDQQVAEQGTDLLRVLPHALDIGFDRRSSTAIR